MRCEDIRQRASEYLDHELEPDRVPGYRHHLETCAACAREFESLEATGSLLATSLPVLDPTPEMWARIVEGLEPAPPAGALHWLFRNRLALVAATLVFAAALTLTLLLWPGAPAPIPATRVNAALDNYLQHRQAILKMGNPFQDSQAPSADDSQNPFSNFLRVNSKNPFEEMK